MKIEGYTFPEILYYDLEHSYAQPVSDAEVVQGITDLGQGLVGEVLFVERPFVGRRVKQGERLLSIQPIDPHGKVIRLVAAVSGEIVAVNPILEAAPTAVNEDPYRSGWLVVIRPDDLSELNNLYHPTNSAFQTWARRELEAIQLYELHIGRVVSGAPAPAATEEASKVKVTPITLSQAAAAAR